jgi:hypothetical protein
MVFILINFYYDKNNIHSFVKNTTKLLKTNDFIAPVI